MKFEKTEVWGFEHAIRGMRNPHESWNLSDSHDTGNGVLKGAFSIGENDLILMKKLIKAGSEHRKFMRQIFISVDITAPIYFWKEFDTYKIGTVADSTSTMHKLTSKPITMNCFEMGDFQRVILENYSEQLKESESDKRDYNFYNTDVWKDLIEYLEMLRRNYVATNDKSFWKELIRLLPESYLQTRTVTMNYENVLNMVHQRQNHKLTEWSMDFIEWAKSLPYAEELIFSVLETRGAE